MVPWCLRCHPGVPGSAWEYAGGTCQVGGSAYSSMQEHSNVYTLFMYTCTCTMTPSTPNIVVLSVVGRALRGLPGPAVRQRDFHRQMAAITQPAPRYSAEGKPQARSVLEDRFIAATQTPTILPLPSRDGHRLIQPGNPSGRRPAAIVPPVLQLRDAPRGRPPCVSPQCSAPRAERAG